MGSVFIDDWIENNKKKKKEETVIKGLRPHRVVEQLVGLDLAPADSDSDSDPAPGPRCLEDPHRRSNC